MSYFYNLKIARKLMVSFLLILALTVVLGVCSLRQAGRIDTAAEELGGNWMPSAQAVMTWKSDLQNFRRRQLVRLLSTDEASNVRHEEVLAGILKQEKIDEATYEALISEPGEKELYAQALALWNTYQDEHRQVMQLLKDNKLDEARDLAVLQSTKSFNKAMAIVDQIVKLNTDGAASSVADARLAYASARFWIAAILVLCVVLGLALAVWMARLISQPLQSAVAIATRVAAGDLTAQIEVASRDETGQLMLALRDMNENLRKIVGQVRGGTDTIATASAEIAAGNQDLSSRTEEQASSLEETASSMEELTATVRQNASNARQASDMAQSASAVAQQGGQLVAQVVQTMESISASSKKIADIIGVIDGIAFQTNILALNAAVEAARAGEQGRGFAVVASEVRNLAQRSAAAAKEIKVLIGGSVDQVSEGTRLVGLAGTTMQQIVGSVHGVSEVIAGITIASDEQSTGIDQVNIAVGQMDQVTQQNAALVEQAAAAAESLQEQANRLKELVGVFQIDVAPRRSGAMAATRASTLMLPKLA